MHFSFKTSLGIKWTTSFDITDYNKSIWESRIRPRTHVKDQNDIFMVLKSYSSYILITIYYFRLIYEGQEASLVEGRFVN